MCEACCDNDVIVANIKLLYPCKCLKEEKSWLDEIITPSNKNYNEYRNHCLYRNISVLKDALEKECKKANFGIVTHYHAPIIIKFAHFIDVVVIDVYLKLSNLKFIRKIFRIFK